MAIIHIPTTYTNNQGRLQINANADELITGTTLSVNVGEYLLDQFGGGQISGTIPLPNAQTNPSTLVQLGDNAYTSSTIYLTAGEYELAGNEINIANLTTVTLAANVSSLDRYDSIYVADDGGINVVQGTGGVFPQIPDFSSGSTEWVYIGSVRVLANQGGFYIANTQFYEPNNIGTTEPEFFGGLSQHSLGGWVPKTNSSGQIISDVDNSFVFGAANRIFFSENSILGGKNNEIQDLSSGNTIVGGENSTISTQNNYRTLIQGNNNTVDNTNSYDYSVSVPNLHISSGITVNTATPDSNYQVTPQDYHIAVQSLSGSVTITLPNKADIVDGHMLIVKDGQGAADVNTIIISGDTAIDSGVLGVTISNRWSSLTFLYNSTLDIWLIT